MNDAAAGSGQPGNPGAAPGAPAPTGQGDGSDAFLSGLSEGNREIAKNHGWLNGDGVLESYANLETKLGESVQVPGENASPDQRDAFYGKVGWPGKSDGYTLSVPKDMPANMPYDNDFATEFKDWSNEARLAPWQAAVLHDKFIAKTTGQAVQGAEAEAVVLNTAAEHLIANWGPEGSEEYNRNREVADRAISLGGVGFREALVLRKIITEEGKVLDPVIAMGLAVYGSKLTAEEQYLGGGEYGTTNNPFADGPHQNITTQGQIKKDDPELAARLIRLAGKDPKTYGL